MAVAESRDNELLQMEISAYLAHIYLFHLGRDVQKLEDMHPLDVVQ